MEETEEEFEEDELESNTELPASQEIFKSSIFSSSKEYEKEYDQNRYREQFFSGANTTEGKQIGLYFEDSPLINRPRSPVILVPSPLKKLTNPDPTAKVGARVLKKPVSLTFEAEHMKPFGPQPRMTTRSALRSQLASQPHSYEFEDLVSLYLSRPVWTQSGWLEACKTDRFKNFKAAHLKEKLANYRKGKYD